MATQVEYYIIVRKSHWSSGANLGDISADDWYDERNGSNQLFARAKDVDVTIQFAKEIKEGGCIVWGDSVSLPEDTASVSFSADLLKEGIDAGYVWNDGGTNRPSVLVRCETDDSPPAPDFEALISASEYNDWPTDNSSVTTC